MQHTPIFSEDHLTLVKWERLGDVVGTPVNWRPSIHMPRQMSRLLLKVTSIRAEPLKEISDEDAIREGIYKSICISKRCPFYIGECWDGNERLLAAGVPRLDFETLWRGLYPEGQKSWGENPWV